MRRWLTVFFIILIFGGGWLWWTRPGAEAQTVATAFAPAANPAVGHAAPDFTLRTLDGGSFQLSALRGKPVVLNFWATWCGPCQNELPALQKAAQHLDGQVVFAAVDQGEAADVVQTYVDKLGLTFTIPMDAKGEIGSVYNVQGLPTTFFIDRSGVIQSLWMGEMNSVTLAENIAQIQ